MKKIHLLNTPLNTKLVEISLENAENDTILDSDIKEALRLLYNSNIEIISMDLNQAAPTLQADIINDYIFKVRVDNEIKIALNFACCLIDKEHAEILTSDSKKAVDNISAILKQLRGERYDMHPLYYRGFAKDIVEKFRLTSLS